MAYGILQSLDTLATQFAGTIIDEAAVFAQVEAALRAHNALVAEKISDLCVVTTERMRSFGGSPTMTMEELDEYGRADTQKVSTGSTLGLPLKLTGISLGWTRKALQNMTGRQLAANLSAMFTADAKKVDIEIRNAFMKKTNYTVKDRLIDNVDLAVKRLVNADSTDLPLAPSGASFNGATHQHYTGAAALNTTVAKALITNVAEHYEGGECRVLISTADEAGWRGLTGFVAYVDPRIIQANTSDRAAKTLDVFNTNNRAIGIYEGAEIWVKSWMPQYYAFAYMTGAPKPLAIRVREGQPFQVELVADDEDHPLRARSWEREFGVGVVERTNGALLYHNNATWADPTIS